MYTASVLQEIVEALSAEAARRVRRRLAGLLRELWQSVPALLQASAPAALNQSSLQEEGGVGQASAVRGLLDTRCREDRLLLNPTAATLDSRRVQTTDLSHQE